MAWVALLAVAFAELGQPWDELDLSSAQRQRIRAVLLRYRPRIEQLQDQAASAEGSRRRDLETRVEELAERRDSEAAKILKKRQREAYEQIRKWMIEGVPLGEGLYRNYDIAETGRVEEGVERPDRVRFRVWNTAPHPIENIEMAVEFYDHTGALVFTDKAKLDRLDPGEERPVVVHYQYVRQWRQRGTKANVELISAEPVK